MAGKYGITLSKDASLSTTAVTMLQIIPATNQSININEIGVGFDGVSNTQEPIQVDLVRQSDVGAGSSAASVIGANDSDGDAFATTAIKNPTSEPTGSTVVRVWRVHPQTGMVYPFGPDEKIHVGAGDRLGLRMLSPSTSLTVDAYMTFEE